MVPPAPTLTATGYTNIAAAAIAAKNVIWPDPLDSLRKGLGRGCVKTLVKFDSYDHSIDTVTKFIVPGASAHVPPLIFTNCKLAEIFQAYLIGATKMCVYQKHQEYTTGAAPPVKPPILVNMWVFANEFFPKQVVNGVSNTLGFHLFTAIATFQGPLATFGQPITLRDVMDFKAANYKKLEIIAIKAYSKAENQGPIHNPKYL
ncbi:hypothetical protein BDK51DRAFT_46931 [Blyttiomyces helicus]|uniref:Uncharacterized protein n=1 Tax=Blyttiomyces helicus TaxID=388810 RepID=A0A4P9VW57_9FUNG|nr:hypothetical protein BDK51DRAFT_46931 [Blyttiomyces helicus]|eukprot:RKO82903.1 hypothetical protein BDK51DRAFT_46931 [Blyttiomyces helicus]